MEIHKDSRDFECEICGKFLIGGKEFLNHKQIHKSWSCPKCQIEVPHNSRIMHLKRVYEERTKRAEL